MCVSAKPVSNGNVESAVSVAKRISADDRDRMKPDSLQYLQLCAENIDIAKPILRTLCQRWVKAREYSKKSFLSLALFPEQVGPSEDAPLDALMFDWEWRMDLSTPLGVRSGDEQGVGKSSFTLLDWRVPSSEVPIITAGASGPNDDDVVLEEPGAEEGEEEGSRDDDSVSDDAEEYTREATEV